jgi:hypothetical protein
MRCGSNSSPLAKSALPHGAIGASNQMDGGLVKARQRRQLHGCDGQQGVKTGDTPCIHANCNQGDCGRIDSDQGRAARPTGYWTAKPSPSNRGSSLVSAPEGNGRYRRVFGCITWRWLNMVLLNPSRRGGRPPATREMLHLRRPFTIVFGTAFFSIVRRTCRMLEMGEGRPMLDRPPREHARMPFL